MEQTYDGILTHPYIARSGKQCYILENATLDSLEGFVVLLDVAEKMCTCSNGYFKKLLPIFKEFYSLVGNADAEIEFIKKQRERGQVDRL